MFVLQTANIAHGVRFLAQCNVANDQISSEEFLTGFTKFKAMAHGKGAISLSAETDMQLHHLAHSASKHVLDRRYDALKAMKSEAHSLVMSENPSHAHEPDVLCIRGTSNTFTPTLDYTMQRTAQR